MQVEAHVKEQVIEQMMRLALEQARRGKEQDQVPVGCVFVRRGLEEWVVVAASHNTTNRDHNASNHCEINCLRQMEATLAPEIIQQCILFVTVEPCIMCAHALNIFHIPFVFFGQYNSKFGGCGSLMHQNNFKCKGGILKKQSLVLLKDFYQTGAKASSQKKDKTQ